MWLGSANGYCLISPTLPKGGKGASKPPPLPGSAYEMPDDPLARYAKTTYLAYALAVSKSRAIPDVCDGQKKMR